MFSILVALKVVFQGKKHLEIDDTALNHLGC